MVLYDDEKFIQTLEKIKGLKYLIDHGRIESFGGYSGNELKAYSAALGNVLEEFSAGWSSGQLA